MMVMDWRENFIVEPQAIRELVLQTKRIAVLGIKTEAQADQPSVYVPTYLQKAGLEIIPVPVYYPDVTAILGKKVYRKLADIPEGIDMVDVFRRAPDINSHVEVELNRCAVADVVRGLLLIVRFCFSPLFP